MLNKALKAIVEADEKYNGDTLNEIMDARLLLEKIEGREVS